jgi:hypothetical protein
MRSLILASLLLLVGTALAVPVHVAQPKRDPRVRMATVAGSGLDASLQRVEVAPDGSAVIILAYKNGAGQAFSTRTLQVPANRSNPIMDNRGQQVSATVPAALGNAIDSFNTQLNSMLATAASAGKLDL